MREVIMTPWLPEGWAGTADFLHWHPEHRAFVLWDLKTIKEEGLPWILKDGAKLEHRWQASAYWHAARRAGFPLLNRFGVWYLPMDELDGTEPAFMEVEPTPEFGLRLEMNRIKGRVDEYLDRIGTPTRALQNYPSGFLVDELETVQPRVQKVFWSSKLKVFEVKLVPHWSAQFCPFPDELCDCNTQGQTKIGEYRYGVTGQVLEWAPRKGYDITPEVYPSPIEINKRRKQLGNNESPQDAGND